jgi:hypothetical protein
MSSDTRVSTASSPATIAEGELGRPIQATLISSVSHMVRQTVLFTARTLIIDVPPILDSHPGVAGVPAVDELSQGAKFTSRRRPQNPNYTARVCR